MTFESIRQTEGLGGDSDVLFLAEFSATTQSLCQRQKVENPQRLYRWCLGRHSLPRCSNVDVVNFSPSFKSQRCAKRKSTGVAKNGIGLCQLPVGVGGALRVCSGWDCREKREEVEVQKGEHPP